MRKALIGTAVVVALISGGVGIYLALAGGGTKAPHPLRTEARVPNIIFILTDDQRWDTLNVMPNVQRLLVRHGVTFTNSFVDDSVCCPSRASTLTGNYPQQTGVWSNGATKYGGFKAFHHDGSTMATWLHAAGYRTGLFGKYLNRYEGTTYVPPGWDEWAAFDGGFSRFNFYQRYFLNLNGKLKWYGRGPANYSTDVLANRAVSFIRESNSPMLVYFAPYAPHTPSQPAMRDSARFPGLKPYRPPSYNETDVSKEPAWVRGLPPLTPLRMAGVDQLRRKMLQSLQAVDRAVARIVQAVADTGRLANTVFVFTSDNGYSWGEHRWTNKVAPWDESARVPLVVRYDPLTSVARTDAHLVSNIDLAPTFADFADVTPTSDVAGRSLVPLLEQKEVTWRKAVLIETTKKNGSASQVPTFCALHTDRYLFAAYDTGENQLYDVRRDPYELHNLAAVPRFSKVIESLEKQLRVLCNPPPPDASPGFPP